MNRQQGFTLIEVLIASVILFAAIGLAVVAYQSSNKSMQSAEDTLTMLRPLPIMLDTIEQQLRGVPNQKHEGGGEALGVTFRWQATPVKAYPPRPRFDPDKAEFIQYPVRFVMYQVDLNLQLGNKDRSFSYQKLGWIEALATGFEGAAVE